MGNVDKDVFYPRNKSAERPAKYIKITKKSMLMKQTVRNTLTLLLVLASLLTAGATPTVSAAAWPFTDVNENSEHYAAIKYVYEHGIMTGTSPTTFEPGSLLTRGQIVTMLYRLSGSNAQIVPSFEDVAPGRFYYYAVGWAQSEGIVNGLTETEFGPDENVTREQLITFLYRYANGAGDELPAANACSNWSDVSSLSNFSRAAVIWAANCGILPTKTNYTFSPQIAATRGFCADYFHAFMSLALGNARVFTMNETCPQMLGIRADEAVLEYASERYSASQWIDPEAVHACFGFWNDVEFVYVNCHGVEDAIQLDSGYWSRLHKNYISEGSMENVELAFISACLAGQEFCQTLSNTGHAQVVVGFEEEISSEYSSDICGWVLFNELYFLYYEQGYNPEVAGQMAREELIRLEGTASGCDSFVCYFYNG